MQEGRQPRGAPLLCMLRKERSLSCQPGPHLQVVLHADVCDVRLADIAQDLSHTSAQAALRVSDQAQGARDVCP
jgi:hypothetical protein